MREGTPFFRDLSTSDTFIHDSKQSRAISEVDFCHIKALLFLCPVLHNGMSCLPWLGGRGQNQCLWPQCLLGWLPPLRALSARVVLTGDHVPSVLTKIPDPIYVYSLNKNYSGQISGLRNSSRNILYLLGTWFK